MRVPFNRPYIVGKELDYIRQAVAASHLSGDGQFTKKCHEWLESHLGTPKALLTHSCTAALEMAAILADVQSGDEVIMPSYTFVSTANAFVLRGAVPVFVDIREDTLNLDESLVEAAITKKTKAIVPVHYAGVSADMQSIGEIAAQNKLFVIEDAAQALMSSFKGRRVGTFGQMATLSFHETKNIISGEGGALLINDPELIERAEVIREKGTNRSKFFRGQVDKYTWVDIGSSFLPSEMIAAFLLAQLESVEMIYARRAEIWQAYHGAFAELEERGIVRRPVVPNDCEHNYHMYYLIFNSLEERTKVLAFLRSHEVEAAFHYVPLHSSPAGLKYARMHGNLEVTQTVSDRLLRLPMPPQAPMTFVERAISVMLEATEGLVPRGGDGAAR